MINANRAGKFADPYDISDRQVGDLIGGFAMLANPANDNLSLAANSQFGRVFMTDMRKAPNLQDLVFEKVALRTPAAQNLRVMNVQNRFLDGVLFTVGFQLPAPNNTLTDHNNRVFIRKNSIDVYGFDEDLLRIVGQTHSKSFYEIFANGDVVSGIIALLVTILIVPSFIVSFYFSKEIAVPEWITSGWLLILGFYFGKASGRSS